MIYTWYSQPEIKLNSTLQPKKTNLIDISFTLASILKGSFFCLVIFSHGPGRLKACCVSSVGCNFDKIASKRSRASPRLVVFVFNLFEKYARQIGKSSPRFGVKMKNIWNHHLVFVVWSCPFVSLQKMSVILVLFFFVCLLFFGGVQNNRWFLSRLFRLVYRVLILISIRE